MGEREAGRELDAEVAEEVMGAEWEDGPRGYRGLKQWNAARTSYRILTVRRPDGSLDSDLPERYSTDIASAWKVVEKLEGDGFTVEYRTFGPKEQRRCVIHTRRGGQIVGASDAETAPLAICLAALDAVRAGRTRGSE